MEHKAAFMRCRHALAVLLPMMSALAKDRQLEDTVEALLGSLPEWAKQGVDMKMGEVVMRVTVP